MGPLGPFRCRPLRRRARAFNNLANDTNDRPTSDILCRLYGWVTPFPPFRPLQFAIPARSFLVTHRWND